MSRSTRNKSESTRGASAAPAGGGAISLLDHEETFFLIKPDASSHHQQILQHVSDTGLQLTMQSFTITQEQADVIVHMYPSVAASAEAAKGSRGRSASIVQTGSGDESSGAAGESSSAAGGGGAPGTSSRAGSMRASGAGSRRPESHNSIMGEILRLARRGGAGADDGRRTGRGNDGDAPDENGGDGAAGSTSQSTRQRGHLLKSTPAGTGDYRSLLQQHLKHLVAGGTSLAMIIAGPNAISTIAALVGPEDPDEARYSAPKSLRARYGRDIVHNAVFCTTVASDVLTLVRLIFAMEGRRAAAGGEVGGRARKHNGAGGILRGPELTASSWMDHTAHPRSDGGSRLRLEHQRASLGVRPPEDAVSPFDGTEELMDVAVEDAARGGGAGGGGLAVESLFDIGSSNSGAVGLRERGPRLLADRKSSAGLEGGNDANHHRQGDDDGVHDNTNRGGNGGGGGGGVGNQQATSELARMLADERRKLIRQSKALRVREMDLLLREQELFRTAGTSHSTSNLGGELLSNRADRSMRDALCTSSSSMMEGLARVPMPPSSMLLLQQQHRGNAATSSRGGGPGSDDDDATTATIVTLKVPPGPYVVKEDLESLVENPRRVGYLFHKLDGKHTGVISREVFLQFYLRSECLHVIGQEDPIQYVTRLLDRQHVPSESMTLEHFTVALMRLLQL